MNNSRGSDKDKITTDITPDMADDLRDRCLEDTEGFISLQDITAILRDRFSDVLRVPEITDQGTVRFMEVIPPCDHTCPEGPDKYFERLGGFCALLLAMGIKEISPDAVSIDRGYPVILDMSALTPGKETRQQKLIRHVDPSLHFSLFNSGLIFRYNDLTEDTLILPKDGLSPLLPVTEAGPVPLADHREAFFNGFTDTYRRCMAEPAFNAGPIRLSDEDLNFEVQLLRKAINEQKLTDHLQPLRNRAEENELLTPEEGILEAEHIFRELTDSMLISPDGNCCFFYVPLMRRTRKHLGGIGMIRGISGIAVFTAAMAMHALTPQIRDEALDLTSALLSQLERYLEYYRSLEHPEERNCTVSFSDGLGGLLFAALRIRQILNGAGPADVADRIIGETVKLILRSDLSGYLPDYFNGLGGTLKILCSFDEIFSIPGVRDCCEKMGDAVISTRKQARGPLKIWPLLGGNGFVSGAAHGQIGIASSLYEAGKKLGRDDFVKAAMAGFAFEDETYDSEKGFWPDLRPIFRDPRPATYGYCTGAAGIGLQMLGKDGDVFSRDLERAVDSCLGTELLPADNLCCGNCAVIDFLLEAGQRLRREDLIEEAQIRVRRMYHRSFDTEFPGYRLPTDHSISTLFYGLTGVGYTIMRAVMPGRLPDILL